MSTILSIGRLTGTVDRKVQTLTRDGSGLTLSGVVFEGSLAAGELFAEQLAALAASDLDETVIPVVWGGTAAANLRGTGFYWVRGVNASGVARQAGEGIQSYTVDLGRVAGYAAPMFEANVIGAKRARTNGSITQQAYMALPNSVKGFEIGANLTPSFTDRTVEGGAVTVFTDGSNSLEVPTSVPSFYVAPTDWYIGAATLTMDGLLMVGRQVPNSPTSWRISNGLMRLTGSPSGITMEKFVAGVWSESRTVKPYRRIDSSTLEYFEAPHTVTVLRNSPEAVTLRLTYDAASTFTLGARFAVFVDITLRRGSRMAAWRMHSRGAYQWGFEITNWGTTFASLTGGINYVGTVLGTDTNAAAGIRTSPATSAYTQISATNQSVIMGLGYYGSGSFGAGATGIDTAQAAVNQWAAAQTVQMIAVAR